MSTLKTTSLYSVHPGIAMVQKWIDTLPEKQAVLWMNGWRSSKDPDPKMKRIVVRG